MHFLAHSPDVVQVLKNYLRLLLTGVKGGKARKYSAAPQELY